jgi:hypothetical protein
VVSVFRRPEPTTRIHVSEDSNVLDIEIIPSGKERSFWLLWSSAGLIFLAFGWYEFREFSFRVLPIWLFLLVFAAIVLLKGWHSWVWYSLGGETVRIAEGQLFYERHGSFLDRKKRELNLSEVKGCVVLSFGLGDSLEPNRLQLKLRKGSLYMGRNLSKSQANELGILLKRFAP